MANKVPWYKMFEWKSVTGWLFFIILSAILAALIYLPDIVRTDRLKKYRGETYGVITNVKENLRVIQGSEGTVRKIESFTIDYSFVVDGFSYNSKDDFKSNPVNNNTLNKVLKLDSGRVKIRYDENMPEKSLIVWD
ncbi:MAG: hypothetical protein Roseis2KO_40590 [Roseivirga sp.]